MPVICVFFFSPGKFCFFITLNYPSKIYIDKGDEWGIVNMFNMFLKVQCRYKHMAWTPHLENTMIALKRMFGVVQRIQFRCFPLSKRTSLFLLPWLTRWCRVITWSSDNTCTILNFIRSKIRSSSVFCWYKYKHSKKNILCRICKLKKKKRFRDSYVGILKTYI